MNAAPDGPSRTETRADEQAGDLIALLLDLEAWLWHCHDDVVADLARRHGPDGYGLTIGRIIHHRHTLQQHHRP